MAGWSSASATSGPTTEPQFEQLTGMHPVSPPSVSLVHMASSPHMARSSPGSHGRVQKAGAPGSKSMVQNGARRLGVSPHSPPPSVQYMPTPNELPVAHGSPQPEPPWQAASALFYIGFGDRLFTLGFAVVCL